MDAKIAALEAAVHDAGRSDGGPERSVLVFQMYRSVADVPADDWVRPHLVAASPYVLVGDPAAMAEQLHARRERWGLSYVVCFERDLEQLLPVVRLLT